VADPAVTPKQQRTRLAKAELWLSLAVVAQGWADNLRGENKGLLPVEQWPADDPLLTLARRYNLTVEDIARLAEQLGRETANRAIRVGYEEAWL